MLATGKATDPDGVVAVNRLDPQALREHAQRDRDIAAEERAALAFDEAEPEQT